MEKSSLKKIINQLVIKRLNSYQVLKIVLFFGLISLLMLVVLTIILMLLSSNAAKTIWSLAVINFIVIAIIYFIATYLEKEIIKKSNNLVIKYFKTQAKDILENFLNKGNNQIIEKILADIQSKKMAFIVPEFKLRSIKKSQVELVARIDFKGWEYIFKKEAIILQGFEIKDEKVVMNYLINHSPYCFQTREFSLPLISLE